MSPVVHCTLTQGGLVAAGKLECRRFVGVQKARSGDLQGMTELWSRVCEAVAGCDAVSPVDYASLTGGKDDAYDDRTNWNTLNYGL